MCIRDRIVSPDGCISEIIWELNSFDVVGLKAFQLLFNRIEHSCVASLLECFIISEIPISNSCSIAVFNPTTEIYDKVD